jgi:molybdopterin/thiamine biosynthesis adenylyltransferase
MKERYSRQILFAPIGKAGQEKLRASRVLLIGCGALGAAQAEILARAGVGKLRIVDRDFVEFSNLQRQTLFSERDAANRLPKAIAAKERLDEINSEVSVEAFVADANRSNIEDLMRGCDLILDGTDNFQTRYLINDASVKNGKIWIYGAAVGSYGVTMTIQPHKTPCLRCIFEEMPPAASAATCDTAGVIQPIIAVVAAAQTTEALKILTGNFDQLHRSLMQFDVWTNDWRKIKLGEPSADCPACGRGAFDSLNAENQLFEVVLCGRNAVQIVPSAACEIDLPKLAERLQKIDKNLKLNEYLLRFNTSEFEITVFTDSRAIVRGTDDLSVARSLYARFVGN